VCMRCALYLADMKALLAMQMSVYFARQSARVLSVLCPLAAGVEITDPLC